MDFLKRKILLEDIRSRSQFTYGRVTEGHVYLNIHLNQSFDDMGMFTDLHYVDQDPDYSPLIEKLQESGLTFSFYTASTPTIGISGFTKCTRLSGQSISDYYEKDGFITGDTGSRLNEVRTYDVNNPFIVGFDLNEEPYVDLSGNTGTSVDRVLSITSGSTGYTISAFSGSPYIGTTSQVRGIQYDTDNIGNTTFGFTSEGWNQTNTSLSALTKQEFLMGITEKPKVNSDVFIDRGAISPIESHLRLSEIKTIREMENYNGEFYNFIQQ